MRPNNERCRQCRYAIDLSKLPEECPIQTTWLRCSRFPVWADVQPDHWCGEWCVAEPIAFDTAYYDRPIKTMPAGIVFKDE